MIDFVFDFIVVSCSLVSGAVQYDLFQIKRNSDNSMSFANFIRTFDTEQRANIAFVALTKIAKACIDKSLGLRYFKELEEDKDDKT